MKAHTFVIHKYKDWQKRAIKFKKSERGNEADTLLLKDKAINQEVQNTLLPEFLFSASNSSEVVEQEKIRLGEGATIVR